MSLCPKLTNASVPLLGEVEVLDESGRARHVYTPGEHPLMVYLDRRELVTLMTLGGVLEALVLGYLRDQHLVSGAEDTTSIQADQEAESAVVSTRTGIADPDEKTARRTVTTGCG